MARTAYFAPGVYVEEIPSARQPIAGVGTNTAAFIGYVEDDIYVVRRSDRYDPVLAADLMSLIDDPKGEKSAEKLKNLEAEFKRLEEDELPKAEKAATDAKAAVDAASDAADKAAAGDAKNAADQKLAKAKDAQATKDEALKTLKASIAEFRSQIDGIGKGGAAAAGSLGNDLEYKDGVPEDGLKSPTPVRPYYLEKITLRAREFETRLCTNFSEYVDLFGGYSAFKGIPENPGDNPADWVYRPIHPGHHMLTHAVDGFFKNGGTRCFVARVKPGSNWKEVLPRLESIDDVSILAAPGLPAVSDVWDELESYCENENHQNVFAVLDPPAVVGNTPKLVDTNFLQLGADGPENEGPLVPRKSAYAAYYFPRVEVVDPAKQLQDSDPARRVEPRYRGRTYVVPSGHMAGVYARTDEERGVHKAPANAGVRGTTGVSYYISRARQELLNPQGVNCIRLMDGQPTVWGARTIGGDRNGEWKYINVRRLAGFIEESIDQGTQWVVFEPNDPNLWSKIILNITAFLTNVWRSGALFGLTPQEAFYVKCDEELNPPGVRDLGQVFTEIGVAIVRPAEFVIFRITQSTGQQG